MGNKTPFFLLILLLLVARAPAQARDAVFTDLHATELPDHSPVHLKSSSPLCSACENLTSETVTYLSEKQTQDKIRDFLQDACSRSFSLEHKCVELMDSYATLLFAKITEIKPEEFCKQYGLCRDTTLFSASGLRSDSTCVFCHHLLDEIMSKLKDPDAEFEIIQILIKECNKIEGHVQQCKRLVLQYIPLILVNGEKFLEKNDVCALVQACPASQKTAVGSFSDEGLVCDA
ncbi:prosaposin-like [Panicum miliaceum]|uniref:Prosaposin-like n=1 Tax=Panicum miliaceum TaxID=4540 RepID=A0A3L6Q020_PANMI|nr:prosaposin-like [Panicum miliaceum]